jgi:hypothetical protein
MESDNIYVNVVINHDEGKGNEPTFATYNVTKTQPFVDKACDYYASIVRFTIPLSEVPLFIMPMRLGQPGPVNPNLTPFIIGINFNGVDFMQNIIYVPGNSLAAPPQPNPNVQNISPYFFCYSFYDLINIINTALNNAYVLSGIAALLPGVQAPFFSFDAATQLISLVAHTSFTQIFAPLVAKPTIVWNTDLQSYLQAFKMRNLQFNSLIGKDFQMILDVNPVFPDNTQGYALFGTAATNPPTYFKYTQEYPTLNNWISLRKLLITSNTLPIFKEIVPVSSTADTGQFISFPILTDFVPAIEVAGQSRSIAYYNPTSQYRLVDLIDRGAIYKIDINIYWEDKQGNIYPLNIARYQQASLKLGFFRKSLYKSPLKL